MHGKRIALWAKKKLIYSARKHRDTKKYYSSLSPCRINASICRGYFSFTPKPSKIWEYVCHSTTTTTRDGYEWVEKR